MAVADIGEAARCGKRRGNEALLGHRVNESSLTALSDERVAFSCECSSVGCWETVWMFESHFRQIAHSETVSLVAPGHCADDEYVIATTSAYLLVSREAHTPPPNDPHPLAA